MNQPEAGSHVVYTRMEDGKSVSYDAIILGYEAKREDEELPAAHLVFMPPNQLAFLSSVDWSRAFVHVFSVPFSEQGSELAHHAWGEPSDAKLAKLQAKLAETTHAVMEQQSANADLQGTIATLTRRNEELDGDLAVAKAQMDRMAAGSTEVKMDTHAPHVHPSIDEPQSAVNDPGEVRGADKPESELPPATAVA